MNYQHTYMVFISIKSLTIVSCVTKKSRTHDHNRELLTQMANSKECYELCAADNSADNATDNS